MAEPSTLLGLIMGECPGLEVQLRDVGKCLVVGLSRPQQTVWLALDHKPAPTTVEHALTCLANMMACCLNCADDCLYHCRNERRVMARRLRNLLGEPGFQRFVENAPIIAGGR